MVGGSTFAVELLSSLLSQAIAGSKMERDIPDIVKEFNIH